MVSLVSCANCVRCEPPTWEDVASARLWCNPKSLWANRYAKQKYKQNTCKTIYDMWSWSWSWDFRSTNRYWALGEQRGWSDGFAEDLQTVKHLLNTCLNLMKALAFFKSSQVTESLALSPFPLAGEKTDLDLWNNFQRPCGVSLLQAQIMPSNLACMRVLREAGKWMPSLYTLSFVRIGWIETKHWSHWSLN